MSAPVILLLALVVLVSALATGWRILFNLTWLILAVTAFSYAWTRLSFRGLSVLRESTQSRVQVGETFKERLGLRNASWLPKLWLEVYDGGNLPGRSSGNVVSIGSASEKRWRRRTLCTRRGQYRVGPLTISSSDPFGLFRRTVQVGSARDVLVYPQVVPLPGFVLPALELPGGNIAQRRAYHSTPTVTTVRDYVAGDGLNKVSWKATARQQKLMVKEFDLDPVADVWIVIDLDRKRHVTQAVPERAQPPDPERHYLNSTVEYAVTVAASVASAMLERGRGVGLIAWAEQRQIVLPDRGSRQLWKLLELLAVVETSAAPPLREVLAANQSYFEGGQTLLVVTPDTSGEWRSALQVGSGRAVPAMAIYVDALSFDPRLPRRRSADDLRRSGLHAVTLRNGDDIAVALQANSSQRRNATSGHRHVLEVAR